MWTSVFLAVALFAHCVSATPTGVYSYSYEEPGETFSVLETTTPDPTMEHPEDYPRNPPPEGPIPPPEGPIPLPKRTESDFGTSTDTADTNGSEQALSDPVTTTEMPVFEAPDYYNSDEYYYTTSEIPWLAPSEEDKESKELYDLLNQPGNNVLNDVPPLLAPPTFQSEDNTEDNGVLPTMPILEADLEVQLETDPEAQLDDDMEAQVEADMKVEMEDNVANTPSFPDDNPPPTVMLDESSDEKMDAEFRQALKAYISIQVAMARNRSVTKIRKMFLLEGWITIGFNNSSDPQKPVAYLAVIPVADEDLQAQFYPDMMEELREANSEDEDMQEPELKDLGLLEA